MRLSKFFKIMFFITLLSLVYIHMQMQIIHLAYQGKPKEKRIRHLIEENGDITYTILSLKSANHIGGEMLDSDSPMQFVNPDDIVQMPPPRTLQQETRLRQEEQISKKHPLLSLLSFGAQAEARTHR